MTTPGGASTSLPATTGASPSSDSASEISTSAPTLTGTGGPASVTVVGTIATGLTTPWGLAFLADGTALVTERDTGKILSISPDAERTVRTLGTVRGVVPGGEGGLLGIAAAPRTGAGLHAYVYYTSATDNRVAELDLSAAGIVAQRDILTGIPKASVHNGGRLLLGPDLDLYIGTGDATAPEKAQDLNYLGGKILRIDPDGGPAAGNPFPNSPLVYSYGHRNVQGLAFDSQGRLWASEFGANTYDELNIIRPGGNYGWPNAEGPSNNPAYVPPVKYWPTSDASPSGLVIAGGSAWMAALRGERLWQIPLDDAAAATPIAHLQGQYGRLRTVAVGPAGYLWLITSNTDGRGQVRPGDDRILQLRLG